MSQTGTDGDQESGSGGVSVTKSPTGGSRGVLFLSTAQLKVLISALETIARGLVPPDRHGHYLAHRQCVALAREALSSAKPTDCD